MKPNMKNTAKTLTFLLFLVSVTPSLLLSQSAYAQSPTKPSIPSFSLALTSHSYDVPNSTNITLDEDTGKTTVETYPGYHVENRTIDIIIQNQPFTPQTKAYYYNINLYYEVRFKEHLDANWTELYHYDEAANNLQVASNAPYTVISIPQNYGSAALVDFQVEAVNATQLAVNPGSKTLLTYWRYEESGWSDIQSINLADGSVVITPYINPTATPDLNAWPLPSSDPVSAAPEFPLSAILIVFLVVLSSLAAFAFFRSKYFRAPFVWVFQRLLPCSILPAWCIRRWIRLSLCR